MKIEDGIFTSNLGEDAVEVIRLVKGFYESDFEPDLDFICYNKVWDNFVHTYEEELYEYIEKHFEELVGISGLICPSCGSKKVVDAGTGNKDEYYCKICKKRMHVII